MVCVFLLAWLPLSRWPKAITFAAFYWIPTMLLILGYVALDCSDRVRILRDVWFQKLGAASYEMYMTHLFMISAYGHIVGRLLHPVPLVLQYLFMVICLVSSVLVGLAIREWVSTPMISFIKNKVL